MHPLHTIYKQRRRIEAGLIALLCLLMLLTPVSAAFAATPDEGSSPNVQADDGALEVGVWWVEQYNPTSPGCITLNNLPATRPDALGLRDKLRDAFWFLFFPYPTPQWTSVYAYGDGSAWEEDWKRAASGGTNENYIDNVDLAYFAGHGSSSAMYFGRGGCLRDDQYLTYDDARGAWGNKDLDWVGIAACNVLDDAHLSDWAASMVGVRWIGGFKTTMSDVPYGRYFGNYIRWNYTMTQAWFKSADETQPQNKIARVMVEHPAYYNDRYFNHNHNTVVDNTFHWWTHPVGSEPARAVDTSRLQGEMPIYQVAPLSLAEAEGKYTALANAFALTSTTPISGAVAAYIDEIFQTDGLFVSPDYKMEMDASAGLYSYVDTDTLWQGPDEGATAASTQAMTALSQEDARGIAQAFLTQNNLLPTDAQFFEVAVDEQITAEGKPGDGEVGAASMNIISQTPTNYQVIYSRIITYTPPAEVNAAGVEVQADPIEFSVMGPGAKLKVYVATSVPASVTAASLMQESVLGGKGGYREVSPVRAAGTNEILTTPVLPEATILKLFEQLEPTVALSYVPLAFTEREVISTTQGYWEGPIGFNQDQLIPVWVLNVRSTQEDGSVADYEVYIPVNAQYMAPLAAIENADEIQNALPGQTINLTAVDASQKLSDLGYDAALDFVLGTGDEDSYIYEWFLNEVSDDTRIGVGRTLPYTMPLATDPNKPTATQKIILQVQDSLSPREPNTSVAQANVTSSSVFLPAINSGD